MQSTMNSQRRLRCCLLGHALKLGTRQIYNNLTKIQHISVSVGLIPTHTGNTAAAKKASRGARAHPHAYGEHTVKLLKSITKTGSSPRIRGTPVLYCLALEVAGLIPTHTGNTKHQSRSFPLPTAHPHAYGEHINDGLKTIKNGGSSPRIRGTQPVDGAALGGFRLIPTHTGNTLLPLHTTIATWAHPHAYGEHNAGVVQSVHDYGSSPRIRGTHLPTKHNTQPKSKKYSVSTRI